MHLTDCTLGTSSNEEVCWVALNFYKFVNQFINFEFDSHCCSTLTWAPWQESWDFSIRNCLLIKKKEGMIPFVQRSLSIWSGCWVAFQLPEMIAASSKLWIILQKNWQTSNHHCQKRTHNVFKSQICPLACGSISAFSSLSWGLLQILKGWPIRHLDLNGFKDKNGSVLLN